MTNRKKYFPSVLIVFFMFFYIAFSSCANEANTSENGNNQIDNPVIQVLDAETERQLKQDCWQYIFTDERRSVFTADEVRIDYYLGTYNGYVIFVNLAYNSNIVLIDSRNRSSISIYGYEFIFPMSFFACAWKQDSNAGRDSFYNLKNNDSLKSISLTENDVKRMYQQYLAYNVINNENFYAGAFEGLDKKIKQQIQHDWWNDIFDDWWREYITTHYYEKDVWIDYYLGTYNGYVIIAALRGSMWTSRIVINNHEFVFPTYFIMYAWKQDEDTGNGSFYRILNERDFNALSLTDEDAAKMYERYLTLNIQSDKRLDTKAFNGLDAETAWQIKYTSWSMNYPYYQSLYPVDDIPLRVYLGTYNDYVIYVNISGVPVVSGLSIYDYRFTFSYAYVSYAWKKNDKSGNGQLFTLNRENLPYEKINYTDILTQEDAFEMYKMYFETAAPNLYLPN